MIPQKQMVIMDVKIIQIRSAPCPFMDFAEGALTKPADLFQQVGDLCAVSDIDTKLTLLHQ